MLTILVSILTLPLLILRSRPFLRVCGENLCCRFVSGSRVKKLGPHIGSSGLPSESSVILEVTFLLKGYYKTYNYDSLVFIWP